MEFEEGVVKKRSGTFVLKNCIEGGTERGTIKGKAGWWEGCMKM